jgi:serine O-acetyltransferase
MSFGEYRRLLFSDLFRIQAEHGWRAVLRQATTGSEGFKYTFWMRSCRYLQGAGWMLRPVLYIAYAMLRRYTYKFGISIPHRTQIGSGLYIGHFGGIVVNEQATIGKNCNLSHGVTIGQANRGRNKGCPIIGDNVYIGPGAKIVGAVTIGNNVAVGANCVVTRDIPDNAVVVGVPGRVISLNGSEGYVNNIEYEEPGETRL